MDEHIEIEVPKIGDKLTIIFEDGSELPLRLTSEMVENIKCHNEKEYLKLGKVVIWIDDNGNRLNK